MVIKKQYSFSLCLARLLPLMLAGMTLASCGMKNPFAEDQRSPQVVAGTRHAPALNPQGASAAPSLVAPPPSPPAGPAEAVAPNPYDAYDASGNPVTPPEANHQPPVSGKDKLVRKPLSGNPYYSRETPAAAPIPAGPQSSVPEATALPPSALASIPPATPAADAPPPVAPRLAASPSPSAMPVDAVEVPSEPAVAEQALLPPVEKTASPSQKQSSAPKDNREPPANSSNILPTRNGDQSSNNDPEETPEKIAQDDADSSASAEPSWFTRWLGKHSGNEQDPARDAPTPALSSVPPMPARFQVIKNEKLQDMQDLQGERIEAEQEKQQLDSEPSQQQLLVSADADNPADGTVSKQSENQPASLDEPVLLGHVAAPPPAFANATPVAPEVLAAEPPPVAENKESSKLPAPTPPADYISALQQSTAAPTPASAPASVFSPPVPTTLPPVVKVKPMLISSSPPPATKAAVAKADVVKTVPSTVPSDIAASDPAPSDVADATETDDALPSPQLLDTAKVLPPSRYVSREQATQQQPAQ